MQNQVLLHQLQTLTLFRPLLSDEPLHSLERYLRKLEHLHTGEVDALTNAISAYCDFTASIYADDTQKNYALSDNLSICLYKNMMDCETDYLKARALGQRLSAFLQTQLQTELSILQTISLLTPEQLQQPLRDAGCSVALPGWQTQYLPFAQDYEKRLQQLPRTGYGKFANYHTFLFSNGEIKPIQHTDIQTIDDLTGYDRERSMVLRNTEVFLSGGTASNVLLYGDAGTGKSTTVKAITNTLHNQGLRLIEVKKNDLYQLPQLLELLSTNPLKFILFIDDLSFTSNDDNFSALKAILEGGVASCGKNALIYATSNRRHLVKESMAERQGDELYLNDTLQETMSLAARFGLTITFQKPNKDEYLSIVSHLAMQYGISIKEQELFEKAEAYALRCNGRSPRVAKHFIELQKAGLS